MTVAGTLASDQLAGTWFAKAVWAMQVFWFRWLMVCVLALLCLGCAQQRIRDDAQAWLRAGDYETALKGLEEGVRLYPDSLQIRTLLLEARTDTATRLVSLAANQRTSGQLEQAEQTLRRAIDLQPSNARALAILVDLSAERRQIAALNEAESLVGKGRVAEAQRVLIEALKTNPRQPGLLALQRRVEAEQRQAQVKAARLGLNETRPISLDFRDANLRTVLDVVSRNSGINFILDKDIRSDARVTVFLKSARVEDAIDLITSTYQLSKKVIDAQTLLVYPNTPDKQREHQEQIVKVFYLASAEAKGAAAFLKAMLLLREPFVDERSNMIAVRDSAANVQLAERLIALYDTNEPEVLLEVEVLEVRTTRLTELGVKLPSTFSLTPLPLSGDSGLTLDSIGNLTRDRIGVSVGGVTVNLRRDTGDFNTLANPRIRVKNKERAKILIGDKLPVVSATTGINGFVADTVSYVDVGLKLDVEPTIFIDDEVSIRIALEVSSLTGTIRTNSGTVAYQIGTRNASTLLRLRDGETQLLAGLINREERSDASRIPGLGDLPTLGRLFSSTRDDNQRTELVLSLTPRILRNVRRPDVSESEMWVGTEAQPRLRSVAGVRQQGEMLVGEESPQSPANGATATPSTDSSRAAPTLVPMSFELTGPPQVGNGETFTVSLDARTSQPLRGMPVQIAFSRERLELMAIEEGNLFKQGGVPTSFTQSIDGTQGQAQAGVLRNTASGSSGQGSVLTLRFKALAAGIAEVSLVQATPIGLSGPIEGLSGLPKLQLQIK